MAVAVTNSTAVLNTITTVTSNLAIADTDALAEVFTITPTKGCTKMLIIIGGTGSGADGDITYSMAASALFAAKIISGTVTKNTEKMLEIDTACVLSSTGTIVLTLTPAATDKLVTNHAAYVKLIQMV
jgi:hypothetical protein